MAFELEPVARVSIEIDAAVEPWMQPKLMNRKCWLLDYSHFRHLRHSVPVVQLIVTTFVEKGTTQGFNF